MKRSQRPYLRPRLSNRAKQQRNYGRFLRNFLLIIFAALIGFLIFFVLHSGGAPKIALTPAGKVASYGTSFTLNVDGGKSGLASIAVSAAQNDRRVKLAERTFPKDTRLYMETFQIPRNAGFKDGPCSIEITATNRNALSFLGRNKTKLERKLTLNLTPPRISLGAGVHNVVQGGSAAVSFTISKPAARAGVAVGRMFFPAFQGKDGLYVCFFAMPYDMAPADFHPKVVVTDTAGNTAEQAVPAFAIARAFRSDKINIPDSFLNAKMSQYAALFPAGTAPIEIYKNVNSNLRRKDVAQLLTIGRETSAARLWSGPFLRLPNAAKRAGFGDQRDYYYNGSKIDHETHLGVDLASVAGAPVPAADSGVIVHAGFFGIYGNCIIIDHGQGVQSLYSHLSQIAVKKGEAVQRGQIIGHTGATGLAGGDHLHFGVLISGLQVNPMEWWDAHWLRNNIFRFIGGGSPSVPTQPAAPAK